MKRFATLFLAAALAGTAAFAQQPGIAPNLSPVTRQYLQLAKQTGNIQPAGFIYKTAYNGKTYMSALIKVGSNSRKVAEDLQALGVSISTRAGNIWVVDVPVAQVEAMTRVSGIDYIELDEPVLAPKLDLARRATRVDSVHRAINLPMAYSGKGVVLGIIDFGFDYNHPTLYDTSGTGYRVAKVWEMGGTGTPPAGELFGRELGDTTAIKAQTTDNAQQTHGTAVAGMAAGSGYGIPAGKWRGMAYDAQMVLVGVRRDSIGGQWISGSFTDFLKGIDYIFKYATAQGKPAVVNISWGSQSGPHDGTTLFNQACDNLMGAGKLVVMSAGNEGEEHIHLSKAFTATDTAINTFLTFTPSTYQRTWVDIWGTPGKTFAARTKLYRNGAAIGGTPNIQLDNNIYNEYIIGSNGVDTCLVQYINTLAASNGKPRMTINVFNKTTDTIRVEVAGQDGNIHMWNEYYYYGYDYRYQSAFSKLNDPTATEGDTLMTVSDMGSGQNVLLVGAYASKTNWININGGSYSYSSYVAANKLVPFSSRGPLADGRVKPDITAPGVTIATSMSSYDTAYTPTGSSSANVRQAYVFPTTGRIYYYGEFTGTSAASPAAAGIVALMLQVNPQLTPAQAKDIIFATAIQDTHTGVLPAAGNNGWGHGKINAYGAVRSLVHAQGIYQYTGRKLDCVLFPNPNGGAFLLDFKGTKADNLTVEVVDVAGRLALQSNWSVAAGDNQRAMDCSSLAKGTYFVRVSGKEGRVTIKTTIQ